MNKKAFSLVELLVASSVFGMLLVILLVVVNHSTNIASGTTARIEVTRAARESLDMIGRDLQSASIPWSRTNTNSLQFALNPASLSPAGYCNKDILFWQTPMSRPTTNGDIAIVGYFVQHDTASSPKRFQLRRAFIPPSDPSYGIYGTNNWIRVPFFTEFGPATTQQDNDNAQKGWVADGVLAMWARCLDRTGATITNSAGGLAFDSRAGYRTAQIHYTSNFNAFPAFVEVVLVCMPPREIERLTSIPVPPTATAATFSQVGSTYVQQIRSQNPGVKSATTFSRVFRLYGGG